MIDSTMITGLAAVMGSLAGASASIATTWMTQRSQTKRERYHEEISRREALYGEFIAEGHRLTADAFEHALGRADGLVKIHSILGRIRLVSSDSVVAAAEVCCVFLIDLYSKPVMTMEEIAATIRGSTHPLKEFSIVCREELDRFVVR
jgi:hypothetical protein